LVRNEYVDDIWVHGESLQTYAIAMIHPNEITLKKLGKEKGKGENYDELCADKEMIDLV
jgi:hypothetical protein